MTATDPDQDLLTYSLSGTDAALFDIVEETGQISVLAGTGVDGTRTSLFREMRRRSKTRAVSVLEVARHWNSPSSAPR